MFRLLGFLIGSLTSILIILMIIGLPKLNHDDDKADQQRYEAAIEMLKAKQSEIESVTGRLEEDVARVTESVASTIDEGTDAGMADGTSPGGQAADDQSESAAGEMPAGDQAADTALWYSFWNPFRSEIAASGFVAQLEKVTGIDYRVVKVKTGVYEVAFAYHDDDERRSKLARISAATGLDLPDS